MKMTKWMAVVMLGASTCVSAMAQTSSPAKDDLFAGTEIFAKGASDVNEVTMDPDTLDLVGGPNSKAAHSMLLNVVRSYSYDKPGMYRMEDVEAIRNKLNTGDWHCSVHTRDMKSGESTDICAKHRTDNYVETAIITVEPKELTFIHIIRKRGEGEHGDMEGLWLGPSLSGLTTLAMISPMEQIHVDLMLDKLSHYDFNYNFNFDDMQLKMKDKMKDLKLDDKEIQKQMEKAQKTLKDAQKQWQDNNNDEKPKDKQPE